MSHIINMTYLKKIGVLLLRSSLIILGCSTKDVHTSSNVNKEIKTISLEDFTKNINNSEYLYIDTRNDETYNGFKVDEIKNGGHLKNSIQYSASFIDKVNKEKEDKFINDKGLDKKKKTVVYDTNKDNTSKVADKLASLGYEVYKFDDYKNLQIMMQIKRI